MGEVELGAELFFFPANRSGSGGVDQRALSNRLSVKYIKRTGKRTALYLVTEGRIAS